MSTFGDGLLKGFGWAVGLAVGSLLMIVMLGTVAVGCGAGLGAGMSQMSGTSAGSGDYIHVSGEHSASNKLLSVGIEGVILGTPPRGISGQFLSGEATYGYAVRRTLEDAAKDAAVKGVLLHVRSPGGTIFGSRAIFEGVKAVRSAKKPVVAYVEGMAASGGVMAIVGADRIYADYGSMVGSIGVLGPQLLFFNRPVAIDGGLLGGGIETRDGIEQTIVTAGRGKDLGNPFRRATEEELRLLQQGVDAEYAQFVSHVAANRKISEQTIRDDMGAHIFDNSLAQQYGLIDGTLDRTATIARLAEMAKVGTSYELVRPKSEQPTFWGQLLNVAAPAWFGPSRASAPDHLRADLCSATTTSLAYYGDPRALCRR